MMEIHSSLRPPHEGEIEAARMAVRKIKKTCNLNPLESSIPHTKTGRNAHLKVGRKFVGSKYLNNMQKV